MIGHRWLDYLLNIWAFRYNTENLPNSITNSQRRLKILAKSNPLKITIGGILKFHQSSKISPKLVTLVIGKIMFMISQPPC